MYGKSRRSSATRRAYIAGKKAAYRSMARKKRKYKSYKSRRRY